MSDKRRKKKKEERATEHDPGRLYPTPEQARLLMAHCLEYISTVTALVAAYDADMIEEGFSTKDFIVPLPSAVKIKALRDAESVFKRSLESGRIPILKKPICQWNNPELAPGRRHVDCPCGDRWKDPKIDIRCADGELEGIQGILRIKKKRGNGSRMPR